VSGEASYVFRRSDFHKEPPVADFTCRNKKLCLARHSGARKSGLHRIDHDSYRRIRVLDYRALGALGSNCGNRNLFSQHPKPAPESTRGQHETVIEILCEVMLRSVAELTTFFLLRKTVATNLLLFAGCFAAGRNKGNPVRNAL